MGNCQKAEIGIKQIINTTVENICSNSIVKHYSPWDLSQVDIKLEKKTCHIPKVSNVSIEKGYLS